MVEFYVRAADSTGNNRTWPAPVMAPNGTFEQAANADRVISTLMGDDVEVRKEFIKSNAKDARFIDI